MMKKPWLPICFVLATIALFWYPLQRAIEIDAQAQGIGAPNPILCNQATAAASAANQIAAAVAGKNIVLCGWDVNGTAAASAFSITAGTGATCGGTPVTLVNWTVLPNGVFVDHPTYAFYQVPTAFGLCVTAATTVNYIIYWGQF